MDDVVFGWGYSSLPMEDMPVSCHPSFGIATNPTSDAHSFLPQGPSVVDGSSVDRRPWPLDIPPHTHNLQVNTEIYPSSLPQLILATHIRDADEGTRTLHLENDIVNIRDESSSVAHPDTMSLVETSSFVQTPTNSNESVISNDSLTYIDVDTTFNCRKEGGSMNVPSVQGHQYTPFNTASTPSISEPSIPSGIPCAPAIVQHQEQRESQGPPQQLQGPASSSSRSSRRPAGVRGARNGPYLCSVCGGGPYSQSQGVLRHHREIHDPRSCSYCSIFKWGRLYLYKKHLEKKHPDVDFDAALDPYRQKGAAS